MRVAFIFAHLDDESYGPLGTIAKHVKNNDEVFVISMCRGNRPGADVQNERVHTFTQICDMLGVESIIQDQNDTRMTRDETQFRVNRLIEDLEPEIVYTHFNGDVHQDHRLLSECVLIACRPKPESTVKQLLMCEIPASTEWAFGQYGDFRPNVFNDITPMIDLKQEALEMYESEIYDYPDARSVESMKVLAAQRGKQSGVNYAEAFQLVFSLSHKIQ
jgi:LmbE family N-acetylglucosaminyl deacetylase